MEAHRAKKVELDSIKEAKDFDAVRHNIHNCDNEAHKTQKVRQFQILWNRTCTETVPCI